MRRVAIIGALCALLAPCAPVRADDEAPPWAGVSDVLALARICRHEAGFPVRRRWGWEHGDDCPAIDAVIERVRAAMEHHRDRGVSYVEALDAYSHGRIFDRARTDAKCDVPWLTLDGAEPACWASRTVPWSRRRDAWLALIEHARAIRAGALTHRCTEPPAHWGCGPVQTALGCRDHERAARAGWVLIDCGTTDNAFYAFGPAVSR